MRKKSQRQNEGESTQIMVKFGGKRIEQVVCHASALALAMTDEALREALM